MAANDKCLRIMRLLVVEDDLLIGSAVQRSLLRTGYAVDWIRRGGELMHVLRTYQYDGVLVDLGLPDVGGEVLVRQAKAHNARLPVVVMTARSAVNDRVALLDVGADDYLVKPFDLDELGARLRAVMRRTLRHTAKDCEADLELGALTFSPSRRSASWHGVPVRLTNKEYRLLELLVRRKHQVLTRAQLEGAMYDEGDDIDSNAVQVYIHFLRRKFSTSLIQTVRGVGYQLGDTRALASL